MSPELAVTHQPTVMEILSSAVLSGKMSVVVIERLTKLQRDQVEYQAKIEFNEAMHRCQVKLQPIRAMADGDKGKYANYAQIDRVVRPIYTEEGISLSFSDAEPVGEGWLRLVCYVSKGGFTREYRKDMPLVTAGPRGGAVMTPTHAQASADSYAKRILISDIFNLAIDKSKDDDGTGSMGMKIPAEKVGEWLKGLESSTDLTAHMKLWGKIYTTANELGDKHSLDILIPAYEAKKAELAAAQ